MKNQLGVKSPDKRLIERGHLFLNRLVKHRTCVMRQLSDNWKEEMGFWRWLSNKKVSIDWLLAQIQADRKLEGFVANRHVLSIQDTSTISFDMWVGRRKQGLSKVGTSGEGFGFLIHPNLLLDAEDGRCLGLGELTVFDQWVSPGEREAFKQFETTTKKTGRWLTAGKQVRAQLAAAKQVTHIADREADFYEMLLEFGLHQQENEHLIVRVHDDRLLGQMEGRGKAKYGFKPDEKVLTGDGVEITFPYRTLLSQLVDQLPVQAEWTLHLPTTPRREARCARVALKYACQVPLRRPKNLYKRTYLGQALPLFIRINVVDLQEILPSGATYQPLHWRIYTSHPIENNDQARQIIQWYCWRWKVEILFATVKSSGLNLENALVIHAERLKKLAILVVMAAIQVIQLLQARDGSSQQPILDCFSEEDTAMLQQINPKLEGNTLKQKNPHPPDSLAFAAWVIARLGGWKGYKTHRPPGIKTMSRGLIAFFQIKNASALLKS